MLTSFLDIAPAVQSALATGKVVALETTVVAHGLPYPENLATAREMEQIVRREGTTPASIAVMGGKVRVGLNDAALQELATASGILKLSRRDVAACLVRRQTGATTVAATMLLAHLAGIKVFATGGIGGVHRGVSGQLSVTSDQLSVVSDQLSGGSGQTPLITDYSSLITDVSADLPELARTPVCVVCSGAKAVLDLPATLEWLETWGVPVIGYQTNEFPAFYVRTSGLRVPLRADSPAEVANLCRAHWAIGGGGVLVTVPIPQADALPPEEAEGHIRQALAESAEKGISGSAVTPFLLKRIVELSGGASLRANIALLKNNAAVAARIAVALTG